MNLNKNFSYTKGRGLWRLLPAGPGLLVIEERDNTSREVFYSCVEMANGNFLFNEYQPKEKIWSGIEDIYDGIIFFHKYAKPDMPMHSGIYAFSIDTREILWENEEYTFSFIAAGKIYCYKTFFEGRKFFELEYKTGELLREIGEDVNLVNQIHQQKPDDGKLAGYVFPETYLEGANEELDAAVTAAKKDLVVAGRIDYTKKDNAYFISFHSVNDDGTLTNRFYCIDISAKKTILEEVLNGKIKAFMPDSFFICNNLLFLLVEKEKLLVYLMN